MGKSKSGSRKTSFAKKILIFFVALLAFISLIANVLCAINPIISPNFFVWTSFFGLAFWPIFFVNIFLFVILILLKAGKSLFISIIAIIIAVPGFMRSCSVNEKKTEVGNVKILSYNVAHFSNITDNQQDATEVKNEILEIINKENPDIVCLQESCSWSEKSANDFGTKIGCKYHSVNKYSHNNNIIFSKFPLEDDDFTEDFNSKKYSGFIKKVKAGSRGTFYLQNTHLQSYNISKDEIEYVGDTKNYVENSSTGKSIVKKLKDGFEERTYDTKAVANNLPENGTPIIICGDFNDTPLSYTYHQMRKAGLKDAFLDAGRGIGKTYCGKLPLLRIDYFWRSDGIDVFTFKVVNKKISDHYPIVMTFNVSN